MDDERVARVVQFISWIMLLPISRDDQLRLMCELDNTLENDALSMLIPYDLLTAAADVDDEVGEWSEEGNFAAIERLTQLKLLEADGGLCFAEVKQQAEAIMLGLQRGYENLKAMHLIDENGTPDMEVLQEMSIGVKH